MCAGAGEPSGHRVHVGAYSMADQRTEAQEQGDDAPDKRVAQRAAEAADHAERAADAAQRAAEDSDEAAAAVEDTEARLEEQELLEEHGVDPDDPQLDQAIRELEAGATEEQPYGVRGKPMASRSPFRTAVEAATGVVLVLLVAYLAYSVRDILLFLLIAMFVAIGLTPAVEFLRRHGLRRGVAAAMILVIVLGIVGASVVAGLPPLLRQGNELRQQLPRYARQAIEENPTLRDLNERFRPIDRIEEATAGSGDTVVEQAPQMVLGLAMSVARVIFGVLTVLVLTLYFLTNQRQIRRGAYALVPRSRRPRATLLSDEILDRIGMYVLGNLATSAIAGVTAGVFLWVMGVPYAAALGLLVGLTDMIPLIGAAIGAVVSCLVAFAVSFSTGIVAVGFFTVYQQFENFVLIPRVMRRAVDVSPAAVIVAVLIGGSLLGVVGALLAVPVAAAIQLIGTEVVVPRQEAQ